MFIYPPFDAFEVPATHVAADVIGTGHARILHRPERAALSGPNDSVLSSWL
jgi:hypothetical protein